MFAESRPLIPYSITAWDIDNMAEKADAAVVNNLDADVSGQTLKRYHEKRCEKLFRTAAVVTMLLLVWALVIVSVASPFYHHRSEVRVIIIKCMCVGAWSYC